MTRQALGTKCLSCGRRTAPTRPMKYLLLLPVLLVLLATVHAQSITTIQLRNRPAAEIIPIVEPMLGSGDSISGQGFKIFLRATPQTLAEVQEMIDALDVTAKILQISVFQGSTRGLEELGFGGEIRIDDDGASVRIESTGTRKRLENSPIHQVRVSEGKEAYIETGQQIPYFSGAAWIAPGKTSGGIEYKNAITGFYVLPRLHGDGTSVTLVVSPFRQSPGSSGGAIATQAAHSTLSGPLGEWLLLGGVSERLQRAQSSGNSRITTRSRGNQSIWIKTDLVR